MQSGYLDRFEGLSSHQSVAECAEFGLHCDLKGQKPLGLIVFKSDVSTENSAIQKEIIQEVRHQIGEVASFREILVGRRLPKTRSGKILRKLLRNIADEYQYNTPSTIDDVVIMKEIESIYQAHNIGIYK